METTTPIQSIESRLTVLSQFDTHYAKSTDQVSRELDGDIYRLDLQGDSFPVFVEDLRSLGFLTPVQEAGGKFILSFMGLCERTFLRERLSNA
jgi:hypothetical protein